MTAAAIKGDYADLKFIKTRSTCQVILEFPIEQGAEIVRMFGAPMPGKPVAVALARLNPEAVKEVMPDNEQSPEPGPHKNRAGESKRHWSDLPPAQQAAIRCNEPAFQTFLREEGDANCDDADKAATYVRFVCGVHSRKELNTWRGAADKWRALDDKFQAWMRVAA